MVPVGDMSACRSCMLDNFLPVVYFKEDGGYGLTERLVQ